MENFIFQNPTKLIFGKGMIARLATEIPVGVKIMVTFGGGSVKKNGVYEQVTAALAGRDYIEFLGHRTQSQNRDAPQGGRTVQARGGGFSALGRRRFRTRRDETDSGRRALRRRCLGFGARRQPHRGNPAVRRCDDTACYGVGDEPQRRHIEHRDEREVRYEGGLSPFFDTRPADHFLAAEIPAGGRHGGYFHPCHGAVHDRDGAVAADGPLERGYSPDVGGDSSQGTGRAARLRHHGRLHAVRHHGTQRVYRHGGYGGLGNAPNRARA